VNAGNERTRERPSDRPNDTTRRHPRSLAEAFADERANSGDWEWAHQDIVRRRGELVLYWFLRACVVGLVVWTVGRACGFIADGGA